MIIFSEIIKQHTETLQSSYNIRKKFERNIWDVGTSICKILLKMVPSTVCMYYIVVLVFFQVTAGYKSCFSKSWVKKSGPNGRGRFSFSDGSK